MDKFKVPESKTYKEPNIDMVLLIASVIAMLGIIYIFSSCNESKQLAKKVKRGYEVVGVYRPFTYDDSANFYKRADDLIKLPEPIIKKSDTIRVPYPVEILKKEIDPAVLSRMVDSIEAGYKEYDKYNQEDCDLRVKKAAKDGAASGYARCQYEYYINGRDSITPEIQFRPDPSTIQMLDAVRSQLAKTQTDNIRLTTERDMLKSSGNKKNWGLGILIFLLGAVIFLKIKFPNLTNIIPK